MLPCVWVSRSQRADTFLGGRSVATTPWSDAAQACMYVHVSMTEDDGLRQGEVSQTRPITGWFLGARQNATCQFCDGGRQFEASVDDECAGESGARRCPRECDCDGCVISFRVM